MEFRLLRIAGVLIAAIGGILIGYAVGMASMYNETMDRLGLIRGGSLATWDTDTLMDVEHIMRSILPPPACYATAIGGLFIILIGVAVAFTASQTNYRRASNLFLLGALAFAAAVTLTLGPSVLGILPGIKKGGEINLAPYVAVPTAWLAWTVFIFGLALFCLIVVGGFLFFREEEK